MGILSDFFIANPTHAPNYAGGDAFDAADKCQLKSITPLQAAQFLAVLRGREYDVDLLGEFQLITPEDAEEWTTTVPQDMLEGLARIGDGEITDIATQFAQATAEELGWSPDDFAPIVADLSTLARRAAETGKEMYLWNSL